MAPPVESYIHPDPWQTILPSLSSQLSALPLVRRLQFHLQTAHVVVIATFPPTVTSLPEHYAITYIDRSRAPETESWWYTTAERSPTDVHSARGQEARQQLLALLAHVKRLPLPESYPSEQDSDLLLAGAVHRTTLALLKNEIISDTDGQKVISGDKGAADTAAVNYDPDDPASRGHLKHDASGSHTHGSTAEGNAGQKGVVRGHTVPYAKFVFPPREFDVDESVDVTQGRDGLPENLAWTRIRPEEMRLVTSRTEIPRKERTLLLLPGVGIRAMEDDASTASKAGRLVAWAFLGVDSSLSSLHVEAEYRGRGLAKVLTRRVFGLLTPRVDSGGGGVDSGKETLVLEDPRRGFFHVRHGENQAHGDVARDNAASLGVARALGGVDSGECFWAWFDLEAVQDTV
jgi:hypothetical protein